MNHVFRAPSLSKVDECIHCGYPEESHGDKATCEACGCIGECELFPDIKHPKKMLLCDRCKQKEIQAAVRESHERQKKLREHEEIKSSGDYFNANIPAIVEIQKIIREDETIPDNRKDAEIAKQIKARLVWFNETLFAKRKEVSIVEHEQRETLIFFNHHMKKLSAEIQKELGLSDISYPATKKSAPKKVTTPSVKKFDKNKLREICAKYNILDAMPMIQGIVTARKIDYEAAVKLYLEMTGVTK